MNRWRNADLSGSHEEKLLKRWMPCNDCEGVWSLAHEACAGKKSLHYIMAQSQKGKYVRSEENYKNERIKESHHRTFQDRIAA